VQEKRPKSTLLEKNEILEQLSLVVCIVTTGPLWAGWMSVEECAYYG
jgi:hypothetical protein